MLLNLTVVSGKITMRVFAKPTIDWTCVRDGGVNQSLQLTHESGKNSPSHKLRAQPETWIFDLAAVAVALGGGDAGGDHLSCSTEPLADAVMNVRWEMVGGVSLSVAPPSQHAAQRVRKDTIAMNLARA